MGNVYHDFIAEKLDIEQKRIRYVLVRYEFSNFFPVYCLLSICL